MSRVGTSVSSQEKGTWRELTSTTDWKVEASNKLSTVSKKHAPVEADRYKRDAGRQKGQGRLLHAFDSCTR